MFCLIPNPRDPRGFKIKNPPPLLGPWGIQHIFTKINPITAVSQQWLSITQHEKVFPIINPITFIKQYIGKNAFYRPLQKNFGVHMHTPEEGYKTMQKVLQNFQLLRRSQVTTILIFRWVYELGFQVGFSNWVFSYWVFEQIFGQNARTQQAEGDFSMFIFFSISNMSWTKAVVRQFGKSEQTKISIFLFHIH